MVAMKELQDAMDAAGIEHYNGRATLRIFNGDQIFIDVSIADPDMIGTYVAKEAYKMGAAFGRRCIQEDMRRCLGLNPTPSPDHPE